MERGKGLNLKHRSGYMLLIAFKKSPVFYILGLIVFICISTLPARAQESAISVHISRPAEGETFYAGPTSLMYSISITGWVSGYGTIPEEIQVQMELFKNEELASSLTKQLKSDGTFDFYVAVNANATEGQFPPEQGACANYCHTPTNLYLPGGAIKVRVTAARPDGEEAIGERLFFVDRSSYVTVPVKVVHAEDPGQSLTDIPVQASTRLYLVRARLATGSTHDDGIALVKVEALAEAPTKYVFRIEPVIVDGVRYESLGSVELVLPPGATEAQQITLTVTSQSGQIDGRLSYDHRLPDEPILIRAIRTSDGTSYETEISGKNEFSFAKIPLDRYLIMADNRSLANNGLYAIDQEVDLAKELEAFIEIPLAALTGTSVEGTIFGEGGTRLPFAWVTVEEPSTIKSVIPDTGKYRIDGLPIKPVTLYVSAPGYYSQRQVVDLPPESGWRADFTLVRQPDTKHVSWEDTEVFVPPETLAEIGEHSVLLEHGWLWGHGGGAEPFTIRTNSVEILIISGDFALEILPNRSEWLYVFSGQAEVRLTDETDSLPVQSNQMVNLLNRQALRALPYEPEVLSALRPMNNAPLAQTWEPTLRSQIRDGLARIGVGSAQIVTLITYIVVFLSIAIAPVVGIHWLWKHRLSNQRDNKEGKNNDEN